MCKSISCDIVIGNFIIAAIEKNHKEIDLDMLASFDTQLNQRLEEQYSTKFSFDGVSEFSSSYPFFVAETTNDYIKIVDYEDAKDTLIKRLERYFRIGLPQAVVDELITTSISVFG